MKRAKELALVVLVSIAVGLFFTAIFTLINNQQNKFRKQSEAECAKVAKLANVQEYLYDNYKCYLIVGNKLEQVEL